MNNTFKTSLLAMAVAGTFSVNAATLVLGSNSASSLDPYQLSQEGIAAGYWEDEQVITTTVIVNQDHSAGSWITLTFDNVDFSDVELDMGTAGTEFTIANVVGSGVGTIAGSVTDQIQFDYGTGSFTFDNLTFGASDSAATGTKDQIKFQVTLGNQLSAGSSFSLSIGNATFAPDIYGAGNMYYASQDITETTDIEDGQNVFAEETPQFSFSVLRSWDNTIELPWSESEDDIRLALNAMDESTVTGYEAASEEIIDAGDAFEDFDTDYETSRIDIAGFRYTNDTTLLADIPAVDVAVTITGENQVFDTALTTVTYVSDAASTSAVAVTNVAFNTTTNIDNVISFDLPTATVNGVVTTPSDDVYTVATVTTDEDTPLSEFTINMLASYVSDSLYTPGGAGVALTNTLSASDEAYGEWDLEAVTVNVPYLPMGYSNIDTNVEFSNHSTKDLEVMIEAFDNSGNTYTGTLADAAATTITKYSDDDILTALGLDTETSVKLNVTFITNADAEADVSIAPYYKDVDYGTRVQIINDQYKK
jgi:hypothetical protein